MTEDKPSTQNGRGLPAVVITRRPRPGAAARLRERLPDGAPRYWLVGRGESAPEAFHPLAAESDSLPGLAAALVREQPDRDWVVIDASLALPPLAVERLAHAGHSDASLAAVSALTDADPALDPLAGRTIEAEPERVDRLLWALGDRSWFDCDRPGPCCWWRREALPDLAGARSGDSGLRDLRDAGWRIAAADHVHVHVTASNAAGDGPSSAPAAMLATLGERLSAALESGADAGTAGLDARPVLLHVLHSWGGGVERFCRDLIDTDDRRQHLALAAAGDSDEHSYGRVLRLHAGGPGAPVLREWRLPSPVHSVDAKAPGYAAVLRDIIDAFAVDQVLVSSLIGHSLEVLETGLPTAMVLHDYFPVCPALNIHFGEVCRSCRKDRLASCLAGNPYNRLFIDKDARAWLRLRDAFVRRVLENRVALAVPTDSVRDHLTTIEPRLEEATFTRIPHGLARWPGDPRLEQPEGGGRLRLVLPGRLKSGKGRELLLAALPALTRVADVWLVGCGKETGDFLARSGVHLIFDYQRDRLPALLDMIRPHAGLLLSTVPETFGYTLSELRSLGLPVIATDLGAFSERVDEGRDGLLIPPDPSALTDAVHRLADEPTLLDRLWKSAAAGEVQDLTDMAAAYAELLPPPVVEACRYRVQAPSPDALVERALARDLAEARRELTEQSALIEEHEAELLRRASWAKRTEKQLDERTEWAYRLKADLERERERVLERQARIESLNRELQQSRSQYQAVIDSRSWRWTEPLRGLTTRMRRVRDGLRFRLLSLRSLAGRTRRSLKSRGLLDTLRRIRHQRPVATATSRPAPPPLPEPGPLRIPTADSPAVSVVIPLHNNSRLTFACLSSLADHAGELPFEVITVDDASTDDTGEILDLVDGIRRLRNEDNRGFIDSCNRGAAEARGEYLVLLNNDTTVTPGWLEALVGTFRDHPDAGLVGAKLVYPDGRLQEAGGIVFSDGSGWNYGRDGDPDHPAFNFLRDADYCSGACIALPRELFHELGGFDTRYRPAYYEDTDLAFRVREAGRRVLYQPACTVLHHEGASSGTDLNTGIKRYQLVNQDKFVERWRERLASQPAPGTDIHLARQHRLRGRVLIVDALVPQPDQDSGSLRMTNLIRLLQSLGYGVTFLPANLTAIQPYTHRLQQSGVEVLYLPQVSSPPQWLAQHGRHFQAAVLCRHYVAANFIRLVRNHCPDARILFDTIDLHYLRERRHAELEGSESLLRAAERTRREELGVAREADVTLVVSPYEKEALAREAPGLAVEVLSNIHEVHGRRREFADRKDFWFIGGFQHPPNVDAVRWFCTEVLPRVQERLPGPVFHIVGSKMPPEIQRLAGDGVRVHGFVPDITTFLDGCRLAVAPLRYGAGVKGKVNMSMAYGQPVVATPTAVEGMFVTPGREAMVAEDAASFADALVRAYGDADLWLALSEAGLDNVRRHFSFEAARVSLSRLLESPEAGRAAAS